MRKMLLIAGAAALSAAGMGVQAHHSFAMFDQTKQETLTGTVQEFQWTNPHTWLQLEVPTDGKKVVWSIEGASPNGLRRQGWNARTFQPGDKVTVTLNPLKNGEPGGSFVGAIKEDGTKIGRPPEDYEEK
ncbi:MAG: hypothetical protein LBE59_02385 [Nevskiaceae bacterium]|jgi:hypothetical protein|nr:hypothetical protein [Nevskiaceae bacterium]